MIARIKSTLAVRASTYGYANARAKAMKATLIPKKDLESMADARNVQDVLGLLERTAYKEDIVSGALDYSGADLIELTLGKHLARINRKLYHISPKEAKKTLDGLFERYDNLNLKAILLGKHLQKEKDDIEPFLVESGRFSKAELSRLLDKNSVEEVVKALAGTGYGNLLDDYLEEYKKEGRVAGMMQALDRHYFEQLPKLIKGKYRDDKLILALLNAEVDMKNITNIFRAKKEGLEEKEIKKMLIAQGSLPEQKLDALIKAKDIEEAVRLLKDVYELKAPLEKFKQDNSIAHFEIALEKSIAGEGLKALSRSILSLGSVVGFLFLKEEETKNIRKIIRAKEFNLPTAQLKENLVFVA